jgi:hypothetical protein
MTAKINMPIQESAPITSPTGLDMFPMSDGWYWQKSGMAPEKMGSGAGREILTASRTYYVRTDGNDNNDGLEDTVGRAFLTIQKAIDTAASIDPGVYDVTIKIANGTYVSNTITCKNILGPGIVTVEGNTSTPANVVIDGGYNKEGGGTVYKIAGQKLTKSSGSTNGLRAVFGASFTFLNLDFGTGLSSQILAATGGVITAVGNYSISGGATYHIAAVNGGMVQVNGRTVTITGTPAFTNFAYVNAISYLGIYSMTFSGSTTGMRYNVGLNSVINVGGGGANYLPGNLAGAVLTGGVYD